MSQCSVLTYFCRHRKVDIMYILISYKLFRMHYFILFQFGLSHGGKNKIKELVSSLKK